MSAKLDEVVDRYVKLRDRKKDLKDEFDKKAEAIDEALKKLENYLLRTLNESGAESVRTTAGTAYINVKTSATVADRDQFMQYVRENDAWVLLDVKANKTAVQEFRDANQDIPPGVNWTEMRAVGVRRS